MGIPTQITTVAMPTVIPTTIRTNCKRRGKAADQESDRADGMRAGLLRPHRILHHPLTVLSASAAAKDASNRRR
jgi:hypothetical protein